MRSMKKLNDGSILIQGAVDGPFEPLLIHQIQHGRPATLDHAAKQDKIKALIQEMRSKSPGLTFAEACERLQKTRPDLFDAV